MRSSSVICGVLSFHFSSGLFFCCITFETFIILLPFSQIVDDCQSEFRFFFCCRRVPTFTTVFIVYSRFVAFCGVKWTIPLASWCEKWINKIRNDDSLKILNEICNDSSSQAHWWRWIFWWWWRIFWLNFIISFEKFFILFKILFDAHVFNIGSGQDQATENDKKAVRSAWNEWISLIDHNLYERFSLIDRLKSKCSVRWFYYRLNGWSGNFDNHVSQLWLIWTRSIEVGFSQWEKSKSRQCQTLIEIINVTKFVSATKTWLMNSIELKISCSSLKATYSRVMHTLQIQFISKSISRNFCSNWKFQINI